MTNNSIDKFEKYYDAERIKARCDLFKNYKPEFIKTQITCPKPEPIGPFGFVLFEEE